MKSINNKDIKSLELQYQPIEGKTYTLFGNSNSTEGYYKTIKSLADKILIDNEINIVIKALRKYSSKKRYLHKIASNPNSNSLISFCLKIVYNDLKLFTKATNKHLKNLSLYKKLWDSRLATTEEQHHLYMLEIELTNRLNKDLFLSADSKFSLQPYCLKDLSVSCKAKSNGIDHQCIHCSKNCFQNYACRILKDNNIVPYIWKGSNKTFKEAKRSNRSLGVLGIACVPELVMGMRTCQKFNIPVIGIPLNANRCIRWFGEFHQNSIDLDELRIILK